MSIVKINAIEVPEGSGPELEKRFANRAAEVDKMPGFEGFELLRPVEGETRYFVYTRWATEEDFQSWVNSQAFQRGHAQANADKAAASNSPRTARRTSSSTVCASAVLACIRWHIPAQRTSRKFTYLNICPPKPRHLAEELPTTKPSPTATRWRIPRR